MTDRRADHAELKSAPEDEDNDNDRRQRAHRFHHAPLRLHAAVEMPAVAILTTITFIFSPRFTIMHTDMY